MQPATNEHKTRKRDAYWADLVGGGTAGYKLAALEDLLERNPVIRGGALLDVGCGTSDASALLRRFVGAARIVRCDYDEAIVKSAADECDDPTVEFRVADIFDLDAWDDQFSLVLFLDMLHEVYSFVGRGPDHTAPIDHERGLDAVERAVASVAQLVAPGGGIAITDNILTDENPRVQVRVRPNAIAAVRRFLAEFPSRRMTADWTADGVLDIDAHDLCIVLTQYNKIKQGDDARWAVEQLEIHQYMTERQYRDLFDGLGFDTHMTIGTPDDASDEWRTDFEMLGGLAALPDKRVTLLAVRR
jgi:SAM-dependent methyltransferase